VTTVLIKSIANGISFYMLKY